MASGLIQFGKTRPMKRIDVKEIKPRVEADFENRKRLATMSNFVIISDNDAFIRSKKMEPGTWFEDTRVLRSSNKQTFDNFKSSNKKE